ncbi:MAG: peptide chain release factor N(5)-glutamine methyltransferase, partial [Pseudomonadota bacterium]
MNDSLAPSSMTIGAALRWGAAQLLQSESATLDAKLLLRSACGFNEAELIAADRRRLSAVERDNFFALLQRRAVGEPVAYILGEQEFWSLTFEVNRDVLIPRADSECLIDAVLQRRPQGHEYKIADMGAGSGCLLAALLSEYVDSYGLAVDRSIPAAVLCWKNLQRLGFAERSLAFAGDWLSASAGPFDIIIANPPYIPISDKAGLASDVRDFEPSSALFADNDGLAHYSAILRQANARLAPGGLAVFEVGAAQWDKVAALADSYFSDA